MLRFPTREGERGCQHNLCSFLGSEGALTCAVGKDPRVEYLGAGQPPFQDFLLNVLEESEDLVD